MPEAIIDPGQPIIDPHHHLWDRRAAPPVQRGDHSFLKAIDGARLYLLEQLLADLGTGHNVLETVFVECGAFYRADAPVALQPIGETEFATGIGAMSASGAYGNIRACAGIVGRADLLLGDAVVSVLERHISAAGGRFRGIRNIGAADADPAVLGPLNRAQPGLYLSDRFREGFRHLSRFGLSFDAWLLEPQLSDLTDLARAFPDTTIVLDHIGTPLGIGRYEGERDERFPIWRDSIRQLAQAPNVVVKLGGLAMAFCGFPSLLRQPRASSEHLAAEWRPYVETCIEAFGADRCMFASNFPVDSGTCDYPTLWNAFKRLARDASESDKAALFCGTARKVYRLSV